MRGAREESASAPAGRGTFGHHYLAREFDELYRSGAIDGLVRDGESADGFWFWDLEDRDSCFFSDGMWHSLGFDPALRSHSSDEFTRLLFEEDLELVMQNVEAHLTDPTLPYEQMVRCRTGDGGTSLVRFRGYAIPSTGLPRRMLGTMQIVDGAPQDELSERLSDILSLSSEAIVVWSQQFGVQRWNRGAERLYGLPETFVRGKRHFEHLTPEFPVDWKEIEASMKAGQTWTGEVKWTRPDGRVLFTETQLQRLTISAGVMQILQVDHDVTPKAELIMQQQMMTRELNHRVKNLFAVIRSLVKLTAMACGDGPELAPTLDKRISALAAAHSVSLGNEIANGAALEELLGTVLRAYPADPTSLHLRGEPIWLPQDRITPMGLILNELATNAQKYGAWSTSRGFVYVSWRTDSPTRSLTELIWNERSPDYCPPSVRKDGFGTQLLHMSAAQMKASIERQWDGDGLTVAIAFPSLSH